MEFGKRICAGTTTLSRAAVAIAWATGLFAVLFLLIPQQMVSAQEPPANLFRLFQKGPAQLNTTPHPAVVRVIVDEGKSLANGTGSLVAIRDRHGLVISNWHVVREASGKIEVVFPDGFRSAATVLKTDADWDLAALLVWRPSVEPLRISGRMPQPGDTLTIAGYGHGDYRSISGKCTQYVAPSPNHPYEIVELSAQARQGDSGGPILNEQGELAGVLFGASRGSTSGSCCARVRTFLTPVWPDLDSSPGMPATAVSVPFAAYSPASQSPEPYSAAAHNLAMRDVTTPSPISQNSTNHATGRDNFDASLETAQTPLIRVYEERDAGPPSADEPSSWSRDTSPTWGTESPRERVTIENTPPPERDPHRATGVDVDAWIGDSHFDRAKSVLALIGLLAVWGNLARFLSR